MDLLKEVPVNLLLLIIAVLLWISKELWGLKKKELERDANLLLQNTQAIATLTTEIKSLKEWLLSFNTRLDNSEKDLDALHQFKREHMKNGN